MVLNETKLKCIVNKENERKSMMKFLKKIFEKKQIIPARDLSVLLIEDNDIDAKVISEIIKKQGWSVLVAENGKKGVDAAKSKKPDIIIMDCEMPVMGGLDACKEIKDTIETKDIPVIFLTGNDSPGNIVECFGADAENYLAKPVNARSLISCINRICEHP